MLSSWTLHGNFGFRVPMPHSDQNDFKTSRWVDQLDHERSWLRGFARRQLRGRRDVVDSEDLVQEAHCKGLARRSKLHFSNQESLRGWLALVVRNILRDRARRPAAEGWGEEGPERLRDEASSPSGQVLRGELGQLLKEGLTRLPKPGRAVVTMRIWEEKSFAEIASALDMTESHARVQFHRAIKTLQGLFSPTIREFE